MSSARLAGAEIVCSRRGTGCPGHHNRCHSYDVSHERTPRFICLHDAKLIIPECATSQGNLALSPSAAKVVVVPLRSIGKNECYKLISATLNSGVKP